MRRILSIFVLTVIAMAAAGRACAFTIGAEWTWNSGDPNYRPTVTPNPGTISTASLVYGTFKGWGADANGTQKQEGWGDSGVTVGWDDSYTPWIGDAMTNGNALDGRWVWLFDDGGWWDLGRPFDRIAVFTSQDHGPYLAEGLEYRVFGSNTLGSLSVSAQVPVAEIYLDGWRPHNIGEDANGNGWLSDDITGVFQFDVPYRYVKIAAWSVYRDLVNNWDEPEIDAVAGIPVPEPGAGVLLASGLAILAVARRVVKRSKGYT